MFSFSKLQTLVEVGLQLFLESVHFILLSLNQLGLSGNYFLVTILHVLFSFLSFKILASNLDLMSFLISKGQFYIHLLLLLSERFLDLLLI